MNHLRILHNGDLRNGSPHWMVKIYEDGEIRGEILTKAAGRFLPKDFKLENVQRFFKIPPELAKQQLTTVLPHHEEIIISLDAPSGRFLCSFLLSEVPKDSDFRKAIEELIERILVLANKSNEL